MTEIAGNNGGGNGASPLVDLPAGALQALYHHVTGKTENMSQSFEGNVVITSQDVDRLHQMILDQIATHHVDFGPTVTVEVKHSNERSFHHSSWEHYKSVVPVNNEVTSEITIKFELILNLQNTAGPQRCVISILLDSALPLIEDKNRVQNRPWAFWIFISKDWTTAKISIDFVDFMVARGFANVVDEWFKGLDSSPTPKINKMLLDKYNIFASLSGQMARIGFAIFLGLYIYTKGGVIRLSEIGYAVCAGLIVWSIYLALRPSFLDFILKRITSNIVPSVLLLSEADSRCFKRISESLNSSRKTVIGMIATIALSVILNVASSYMYTYLTQKGS
jgi:hypothetical protein